MRVVNDTLSVNASTMFGSARAMIVAVICTRGVVLISYVFLKCFIYIEYES